MATISPTAAAPSSAGIPLQQLIKSMQKGENFFQKLLKIHHSENPMENDNKIRELATQLSKIMQEAGITEYGLHYTGSGDSTDGTSVTVVPENLATKLEGLQVTYGTTSSQYNEGKWQSVHSAQTGDFEEAAYSLASQLWNRAGQSGWYNNAGGYGDLTIFPGGFIEFRHVNYDNESYDDEENGVEDDDRAVSVACHWRFNVLVGPIDADYEDTALEPVSP